MAAAVLHGQSDDLLHWICVVKGAEKDTKKFFHQIYLLFRLNFLIMRFFGLLKLTV